MNEHVIAEIIVCPLGTATPEVGPYVKGCIDLVKKAKGIKYEISAMGTIVEGPLDKIIELVREMHELPFNMGAQRVYTILKIDDRRDKEASIASKVKTVS